MLYCAATHFQNQIYIRSDFTLTCLLILAWNQTLRWREASVFVALIVFMEVYCMSVRLSSVFCNLLLVLFLFAVFTRLKIPRKMNVNITQSYSELLRVHPRVTGNRLSRCCGKRDVTNTLFDIETLAKRKKKKMKKSCSGGTESRTPPRMMYSRTSVTFYPPDRIFLLLRPLMWRSEDDSACDVWSSANLRLHHLIPLLGVRSHVLLL